MPSIALRCTAGTSGSLSVVNVNEDTEPFELDSPEFQGRLAVRIKDYHGAAPKGKSPLRTAASGYFEAHPQVTWSMQLQGRFLKSIDADQVVFGNIFKKPIRDYLPYGTGAALKFVHYIDPGLEQDIYADEPWAWSPLIATMNFVQLSTHDGDTLPEWDPQQPPEDVSAGLAAASHPSDLKGNPDARRKYFANAEKRKAVHYGPEMVLNADFCNGFINFDTLALKLYAGFEIPLAKYWDGQPVAFICRTRDGSREYFRIEFTIVEESIVKEKRDAGHTVEHAEDAEDGRGDDTGAEASNELPADKDKEGID